MLTWIIHRRLRDGDDLRRGARLPRNGAPGFVFHTREGTETLAFEIAEGAIDAIYSIRNPDQVGHLAG
jgi:hypothetical protein